MNPFGNRNSLPLHKRWVPLVIIPLSLSLFLWLVTSQLARLQEDRAQIPVTPRTAQRATRHVATRPSLPEDPIVQPGTLLLESGDHTLQAFLRNPERWTTEQLRLRCVVEHIEPLEDQFIQSRFDLGDSLKRLDASESAGQLTLTIRDTQGLVFERVLVLVGTEACTKAPWLRVGDEIRLSASPARQIDAMGGRVLWVLFADDISPVDDYR